MAALSDLCVHREEKRSAARVLDCRRSSGLACHSGFYTKLEETLESFGFARKVRALCAPAYDKSRVGRPGIDPVVYLKMIMVGFFEDLPSERAIAARCFAVGIGGALMRCQMRWSGPRSLIV